jgi:hypothetical protein
MEIQPPLLILPSSKEDIWGCGKWFVLGLFESPWEVKFVRSSTLESKCVKIEDYRSAEELKRQIKYRVKRGNWYELKKIVLENWIKDKANEWGLKTLYTRFTPEKALEEAKKLCGSEIGRRGATLLDAVAELIHETELTYREPTWRVAFYVQQGKEKAVFILDNAREGFSKFGVYTINYGAFYDKIPLYLADWVRKIAKERGWEEISNLR